MEAEVEGGVAGVCSELDEEAEVGAVSEDAFGGLTGPGRSSTLCFRAEVPGTTCGGSFEGGSVVEGGLVVR